MDGDKFLYGDRRETHHTQKPNNINNVGQVIVSLEGVWTFH